MITTAAAWAIAAGMASPDGITWRTGHWPAEYGNHRARVVVEQACDAVRTRIPWRRRDPAPEARQIIAVEAATGERVPNVARIEISREAGYLAFGPVSAPGEVYVYYLPFRTEGWQHLPTIVYPGPEDGADPSWLAANGLDPEGIAAGRHEALPLGRTAAIEARGEFHRFDPMEVIATREETEALIAAHPDRPYLLFPEDRLHPIRMTDDLPLRWIEVGPSQEFAGEARRGEYYAFQLGVFAARADVPNLAVEIGELTAAGGNSIPAAAVSCLNLGGTDWLGNHFTKSVSVPKGKVQALWFVVRVPEEATPGDYKGTLVIRGDGLDDAPVTVHLRVTDDVADEGGTADLATQARLAWLDSTVGIDNEPTSPYVPLTLSGREVSSLMHKVRFGLTGLPEAIRSPGGQLLAAPIGLHVATGGPDAVWLARKWGLRRTGPGAAVFEAQSTSGPLSLTCEVLMEFDGYMSCRLELTTSHTVDLTDIRLAIPLKREFATYMMGLGRKGGYRPESWEWKWDVSRANNIVWLGDVTGGMHLKLKGPKDDWSLYNLHGSGIPDSWDNQGRGGCRVRETALGNAVVEAYTGPRKLEPGRPLELRFALMPTPVKPFDQRRWSWRYYHAYVPAETAVENGCSIINIHHGNELNPNINYPFVATDALAAYVRRAHELGVKVKIYYTVRELSNFAAEIWALRSLGHEVYTDGPGGGDSWLQEHLVSGYAPAWHHPLGDGLIDAAIATTGLSRWHNYYLEGLGWLLRHVEIDGLYLDGIGYDREIMKRVRRVMDRARPDSLIDFHSGNHYLPEYGLNNVANQYLEHFPYVDSIWFGEGFDYNESPDYWLVEVSGIPFGLFGEMLQDNGNPWRGMVYGMTARYYAGADPKHIWRLWDEFGIADAEMLGYWDPDCPVRTGRDDVLATVYRRPGRSLIALASWSDALVECRLQVDWRALGLDPAATVLRAPQVAGFQDEATFAPGDPIPVEPGRGWMLVASQQ